MIFCGIPASGKTSFYRERFFATHVRINLDMLRTRRRESLLLEACLKAQQRFVVDNTNLTREDRARYIVPALAAGFRVVGYFFAADPKEAFARNRRRPGVAAVPAGGLFGAQKRLRRPALDEGFTELFTVTLLAGGGFEVTSGVLPPP